MILSQELTLCFFALFCKSTILHASANIWFVFECSSIGQDSAVIIQGMFLFSTMLIYRKFVANRVC